MKTFIQNLFSFLFCLLLCLGLAIETKAQQDRKISLQGFLKDANGRAIPDGPQNVIFKLYSQDAGGTAEWTETQTVEVFGGVYSTQLGKIVKMDDLSWRTKTYFVGVTVQDLELVPRTELTFAPYSLGSPRATLADTAKVTKCSGAVGDVKYSMLNPTNFAKANGSCWVPMDGRALATTDVLRQKYGITTLPNAGGLFLRGQEFDNSPNNDPSRTSNSAIAQFQDQAVQGHNHALNLNAQMGGGGGGSASVPYSGEAAGWIESGKSFTAMKATDRGSNGNYAISFTVPAHDHRISGNTDNNTGVTEETRPKNLNLWTYIRIN